MKLARIGSRGPGWKADDLSGAGAALSPGRWNQEGERVVYAAIHAALAVLETVAHIQAHGLPIQRYLVEIDVPARVWARRRVIAPDELPRGWDAIPHTEVSRQYGSHWYVRGEQALLELPSAIVPEERIVLIHAAHPDTATLRARIVRPFDYGSVLRS